MLVSCSSIGPKTITRDRFDYNKAISDSWKEQTLLNIIKLRYADMPLFVEVASIVSGYSLEQSVSLGGELSAGNIPGDSFNVGAAGTYIDRPTVTYVPLTGEEFNRSFMTPIPPRAVIFLIQNGWPADLIFLLTVDAINGLRSTVAAGSNQRKGDEEYLRVTELLREIQLSGAIGMEVKEIDDNEYSTLMIFHREGNNDETEANLNELGDLLGLKPDVQEFQVSYGFISGSDTEIVMLTRSMLNIMIQLSTQIEAPVEHVNEGRTVSALELDNSTHEMAQVFRLKHSTEEPEDAFVAVKYRDYWFWIDDRDFLTKNTFGFLMILNSLMEKGSNEHLPQITIPAN
jgi:hypothetical protein